MLRRGVSAETPAVEQGFWSIHAEAEGIGRTLSKGNRFAVTVSCLHFYPKKHVIVMVALLR